MAETATLEKPKLSTPLRALPPPPDPPSLLKLAGAFAAVYLIWGSTYLAIRFAVETIPPFLMAGSRFVFAGLVLYAYARGTGAERPVPAHWKSAAIVGGLLLLGGNGGVVWAEQYVSSGGTALLVATVPIWMVVLNWLRRGGVRPTPGTVAGLAIGMFGIAILVNPTDVVAGEGVDPVGAIVLVGAALSWALGSIYSRHTPLPASPLLATAMEMLCGGALQLVAGAVAGDVTRFDASIVTSKSLLSVAYLIVFGSLIGFSAYIWLLRVTTPAKAATYAYVNPVVAVLLGWLLADEGLEPRTLLAAGVIVAAVVLITRAPQRGQEP